MNSLPRVTLAITSLVLALSLQTVSAQEPESAPDDEVIDEIRVFGDRVTGDPPFGFSMDVETLERIPGTQDDPIKAIITLPGVLTNNDFDTGVALRGTRPEDNRYFLDFLPTGYLFHLTGISVVDGDLMAQLHLMSAGFGVTHQGVIGGIISANTKDPAKRFGGVADISIIDAGFMVEGPLTARQRATAAARVSYYDLVVGDIVEDRQEEEEPGLDIVQLPRYTDYRLRYQVDVGSRGKLDFLVDGAADDVQFNLGDDAPSAILDPARAGSYRYDIAYSRQGVVYSQPHDAGKLRLGLGRVQSDITGESGDIGAIESEIKETVFRLQNELRIATHELTFGLSVSGMDVERDLLVRDTGCTEFDVDCLYTDQDLETSRVAETFVHGNVFIEDQFALSNSVDLTIGLGYTKDDYLNNSALEPRMRIDWAANDFIVVSAGTGRYSQMPRFDYTEQNLGNPSLANLESDHYVVGVNAIVGRGYLASINAFYKSMDNLVTSDPVIRYDNRGEGRAWGGEFLLRKGLGKLTGWASATWSRSFRENTVTGEVSRFQFDQPLSLSVIAKYDFSETLAFSGRIGFHSGAPVTPIFGGQPHPNRPGDFLPVYGGLNSERLPDYFRTDLRLDWKTGWRDVLLYFEIINATNHQNVMAYEYNRDYSERRYIEQLPRFISFGAKKRF
jgi:TonB dependent receptor-like, beta-barrel